MTTLEESQYIHYLAHMLDEAMDDKALICEDKEGKNLNKADRWVKDHQDICINAGYQTQDMSFSPRYIVNQLRKEMPHVRNSDCKFMLGTTRAYLEKIASVIDSQIFSQEQKYIIQNDFNRILKFISMKNANKFDNNLNGMSYDQLHEMFSKDIDKDYTDMKTALANASFKSNGYTIIPIDTSEQLQSIGKEAEVWCIYGNQNTLESYTHDGLGKFYICLKDGYKDMHMYDDNVDKFGLDDYAKSMIAIAIDEHGNLDSFTDRYDEMHDELNAKDVSEILGVNFYKTFTQRSDDDIYNRLSKYRVKDDDVSRVIGASTYCIPDNQNGNSTGKCSTYYIKRMPDGTLKQYQKVNDQNVIDTSTNEMFRVDDNGLKRGAIKKVVGDIVLHPVKDDSHSWMDTLPRDVEGTFDCSGIALNDLVGLPAGYVTTYICDNCGLTSLKGAPEQVDNFICTNNKLTTLKHFPQCRKHFNISWNDKLTSLEGLPSTIDSFNLYDCNSLTSLTGAPSIVRTGEIMFGLCKRISKEQYRAYRIFLKHPTDNHLTITDNYIE